MQISLSEAIDIHVKVLKRRHGRGAVHSCHERAAHCRAVGDLEGEHVWLRVAAAIQRFHDEDSTPSTH